MFTEKQIVKLYEESGLSESELAEAFSLDPVAVKIALQGNSKQYREEKHLFAENEVKQARDVMTALMYSDESEMIRYRACKFVINEAKGRHDKKEMPKIDFNINIINAELGRAKEAIKRAKGVIEIEDQKAA